MWIGGLSSRVKKSSIEKYFGNYGKIREIDWNPGDQYAYILYDSVGDAEDARNRLNEKRLPGGSSDELRIDYADPKRFESNLDDQSPSRSRSLTVSNIQSRSHSRSRTRSPRTQSKSLSPQPPRKRTSSSVQEVVSGNNNGHYSSGSNNDEKTAFKRQKVSSTSLSRKIKTPPIDDSYTVSRDQSRRRHHRHHHHDDQHDQSDVELKIENSSEIEMNFSQKEEETNDLLIKDTLINKESQLSRITNIDDINTIMKHTWFGVFTLKKIAFPTKFFCLAGNKHLAEELLPTNLSSNSNSSISSFSNQIANQPLLRITQRLRLDPLKVEELEKKLYDSNFTHLQNSDNCEFSVLIALPNELDKQQQQQYKNDENSAITTVSVDNNVPPAHVDDGTVSTSSLQQRSLHNLILYLNQKTAAGVIPLPDDDRPTAMVHAFPPNCQFSIKLLKQLLPNVKTADLLIPQQANNSSNSQNYGQNSDYLIVVLLKN